MAKALPAPDAPMRLADGTVLTPTTTQTFARVEVPSNSNAQRLVSSTRRKLVDLPAVPKQLNGLAALLVYTASGLSEVEIGIAMNMIPAQLAKMREHPAYLQLQEAVIAAVQEQSKSTVTQILAEAEVRAAEQIGSLISSEDEKIALAASKDVLDRRGHAPKQQVDIRAEMLNTFRIEVVDKRGAEAPVIDMEVE